MNFVHYFGLLSIVVTLMQSLPVDAVPSQAVRDLIRMQTPPELLNKCIVVKLEIDLKMDPHLDSLGMSQLRLNGVFDLTLFREFFVREGECVFVVAMMSSPLLQAIDQMIQRFRLKILILLHDGNDSSRIEADIQDKKIQSPLFILRNGGNVEKQQKVVSINLACPHSSKIIRARVDVWRSNLGFLKMKNFGFINAQCYANRSPLLGKAVKVSVVGIPPYITFDPASKAFGGIDLELFKIVAKKFYLNVTIKPEKNWLEKLDNGTLVGTVASVFHGDSEIGIGDIGFMRVRHQLVDYTTALYTMENGFVSRRPAPLEKYKNIVLPFDEFVWLCIALAAIVVSCVIFFIDCLSGHKLNKPRPIKPSYQPSTKIFDIFLSPVVMLVTQTEPRWLRLHSKSFGANVILTFWSVACTIFIFFYTSNLRASLISVERETPIDTVKDVLKEGKPVYFPRGSFIDIALQSSIKKEHRDLYEMVLKLNSYVEYTGGSMPVEALLNIKNEGKGIGIATKHLFRFLEVNIAKVFGPRPFYFSKEIWLRLNTGFVVQKHSYIKEDLDRVLLRLIEFGILDKLFKAFDSIAEDDGLIDMQSKMTIGHFLSSIFFLAAMSIIAFVIFIFELGCHQKKDFDIDFTT